jgi:hypothetical protein
MNITCTGCQGILVVSEEMYGKSVRCGKCGTITRIGDAPSMNEPAPSDLAAVSIGIPPAASEPSKAASTRSRDYDDEDDDDLPTRRRRAWPGPRSHRPSNAGQNTLVILLVVLAAVFFVLPCFAGGVVGFLGAIFEEQEQAQFAAEAQVEMAMEAGAMARVEPPEEAWHEDFELRKELLDPNPDQFNERLADQGKLKKFIDQNLSANDQEGPLAPKSALWPKVARSVENDRLRKSPLGPGNRGFVPFMETAPQGGILIGFFVSAVQGQLLLVHYVQPIYLTAEGEKAGQRYGTPGNTLDCVKAKKGYAVGGLLVRSGDLFDGFTIRFMKVQGERLDPNDFYDSAHYGGQGGEPMRINGEGRLIVGIHGRRLANPDLTPQGSITSLGLISLP